MTTFYAFIEDLRRGERGHEFVGPLLPLDDVLLSAERREPLIGDILELRLRSWPGRRTLRFRLRRIELLADGNYVFTTVPVDEW